MEASARNFRLKKVANFYGNCNLFHSSFLQKKYFTVGLLIFFSLSFECERCNLHQHSILNDTCLLVGCNAAQ